jgi:hypothetical protein
MGGGEEDVKKQGVRSLRPATKINRRELMEDDSVLLMK